MSDDEAWRRNWEIYDTEAGSPGVACHISGLSIEIAWFTLDPEDMDWGWRPWGDVEPESLVELLRERMGDDAYNAYELGLMREAMILWRERGYKDDIRSGRVYEY